MNDIESRAREYLAEHSEYSEVFGRTFIAVDTLTAMVEFAKQEIKEISDPTNKATENFVGALNRESAELSIFNEVLENKYSKGKEIIKRFLKFYERIPRELYCKEFQNLLKDAEKFLSEE